MRLFFIRCFAGIKKATERIPSPLRFILLTFLLAFGWAVLYFFPNTPQSGGSIVKCFYVPCVFHKITGFYCPGCGSTRSLTALVHGDIFLVWRYNKLLPFLLLYLFYRYICYGFRCFGVHIRAEFEPPWALWTLVGVIIMFWIFRNIPCYPFTLLAPQ